MRNGVERNLAAECGGVVASQFGGESMSRFVTSRREKKNRVIDKSQGKELGSEGGHKSVRLGFPASESKPPLMH